MHTPEGSESNDRSAEPGAPPPPAPPIQVRNIAFILLPIAIVVLLLQFMRPVLLPLVLGALLFYALDPAVDRLQKLHVPRALGAALTLFIVVASCGVLAYTLQGQALTVIDQLPAGARKLAASLRKAPGAEPGAVEKVQQAADELKGTETSSAPKGVTRVQIEEPGFRARTLVWSTSMGLASAVNQLIMVLFLTNFMLLSDQLFKRKLVEIVGTLSQKKVTVTVLEDIAGQIEQSAFRSTPDSRHRDSNRTVTVVVTYGKRAALAPARAGNAQLLARMAPMNPPKL